MQLGLERPMVVGAERAARPVRPRFLGAKPRSATRRLEEEGNVERCSRERVRGSGGWEGGH